MRTPRRIFLLAQKTGQTNAFFFDGAGHQILSIDIRVETRRRPICRRLIHTDLPDSNVTVEALNDNVVLTGTVASAQEAARAAGSGARALRAAIRRRSSTCSRSPGSEQVMLKVRVAEMQRHDRQAVRHQSRRPRSSAACR